MSVEPIKSRSEQSINDLIEIQKYCMEKLRNETLPKIEDAFKRHNEAMKVIEKVTAELKEPQ